MKALSLFCLIILVSHPITVFSDTLKGKVVSVLDGETITVLTPDKQQVKVRFYGIDTPEKDQPYGQKAKRFTFSMTYGKQVEIKPVATDQQGMTVGIVRVNDFNVNEEIIRSGYGWQYRDDCTAAFCSEWLRLENDAKISGVGLWKDKNPVPPWEWSNSL